MEFLPHPASDSIVVAPLCYITSSIYLVNTDPPFNFNLIPLSSWPVQGKRPEVLSEDLDPSSRNAASGLFSDSNTQIRTKRPRTLHTTFSDFLTHFFSLFSHSTARDPFSHFIPIFHSTSRRTTDPFPEPTHRELDPSTLFANPFRDISAR